MQPAQPQNKPRNQAVARGNPQYSMYGQLLIQMYIVTQKYTPPAAELLRPAADSPA